MKTIRVRIKQRIKNGKKLYQPQVKTSWYTSWDGLTMLLFYEKNNEIMHKLKMWTEIFGEARTELSRFCYLHNFKFKLVSIK
jgi:hypothetical protein